MNTLKAEKRDLAVKAKRLRREGYVTGNVFGREIEGSIPVKMLTSDVEALLKTTGKRRTDSPECRRTELQCPDQGNRL